MNWFKQNKTKILFVVSSFALFFLISLLTKPFTSLKILYLIPISFLTGIGLITFLKDVLPIKNILNYICLTIFLSLFLNTLVIFLYGCLGGVINSTFFLIYLCLAILANVVFFLLKEKELFLCKLLKDTKLEVVDYIFIGLFIAFFLILLNIGLENYFPNWDSFTYWGVDAKYIYEHSAFRTSSFDLLKNAYLPFYPLQLNYVYHLYGGIVEQFSGLLSLFYAFLGVATIISYNINIKSSSFKKALVYLTTFAGVYALYKVQGTIFSQYSESLTAVIFLFYGLVLFKNKYLPSDGYKRFALIFLLSVSLLFIKHNYSVLSFGLLAFFALYEFIHRYKKTSSNKEFFTFKSLFTLIILAVYVFIVFSYRKQFIPDTNIVDYATAGFNLRNLFTSERLTYVSDMVKFLLTTIPLFMCCYVILVGISLYSSDLFTKKKKILVFILPLFILLFPFGFYFLQMWGFADMSLIRYVSIVFFLVPLVFIKILPDLEVKSKIQRTLSVGILCLIMTVFIGKVAIDTHVDLNFTPTTGRYKDFIWHQGISSISEKVYKLVADDDKIMIVDQEGDLIGNMDISDIILRYYISNNSVGQQYRFPVQDWYPYMKEVNPDYILVYTYDNYWEGCNNILEEGHTYLIKNSELSPQYQREECFFGIENIKEL